VVRSAKSLGLKSFAELTTPSARTKVASRHFLDRAATPPFQGGECVRTETAHADPGANALGYHLSPLRG